MAADRPDGPPPTMMRSRTDILSSYLSAEPTGQGSRMIRPPVLSAAAYPAPLPSVHLVAPFVAILNSRALPDLTVGSGGSCMNRHTLREIAAALVVVVLVGSPVLLGSLRGQTPRAARPDLVALLKASPGVLGVDAARTASGKQVVFAWFENKQAMLTWYYSEPHQK